MISFQLINEYMQTAANKLPSLFRYLSNSLQITAVKPGGSFEVLCGSSKGFSSLLDAKLVLKSVTKLPLNATRVFICLMK